MDNRSWYLRAGIAAAVVILGSSGCGPPGVATPSPQPSPTPPTATVTAPSNTPAPTHPPLPTQPDPKLGVIPFFSLPARFERVTFAPGASSASVQGSTPVGVLAGYLVRAEAGQHMTVTLTSQRGPTLNVYSPRMILQNNPADRYAAWDGILPEAGDYALVVDPNSDGAVDFTLEVSIPPGTVSPKTCAPPAGPSGDWLTYCDSVYGFGFRYPPGGSPTYGMINLPFAPGTNLSQKYLVVTAQDGVTDCAGLSASGTLYGVATSDERVTLNGTPFRKALGYYGGAGTFEDWLSYSTQRDGVCLDLVFITHSVDRMIPATHPPEFDHEAETAVFGQIMDTFSWPGS